MVDVIQVTTTVENRDDGEKLARLLLSKRLAACVQIAQCSSLYHWQGAIEQAEEYTLVMKSRSDLYNRLEQCIVDNHPYETPEIIGVPLLLCSCGYLQWLNSELQPQ